MKYIYTGLFFSLIYSVYFLPKNEGECPIIKPTIYPFLYNGMVIIPINKKKAIHIHHWMIYLFILFLSIFIYIPKIVIGFSFGLFIQGIIYKDCFQLLCDNFYNQTF